MQGSSGLMFSPAKDRHSVGLRPKPSTPPSTPLSNTYFYSMSRAAKLTLTGVSVGAAAIVVLVHYQQNSEKVVSLSLCPSFARLNKILLGSKLIAYRLCMRVSYEISSSKESRKSGKQTLKCKRRWKRSIRRCKRYMMEAIMARDRPRKLLTRERESLGGALDESRCHWN